MDAAEALKPQERLAAACAADVLLVRPGRFGDAGWSLAGFAVLTALLITARHAGNFARMRRGEETRWGGQDLKPTPADPTAPATAPAPAPAPAPTADGGDAGGGRPASAPPPRG